MFELSKSELENLRSQFGTSSWGGTRYSPMCFTEQGVSMLSSILNTSNAIRVNIQIIRHFTKMPEIILNHKDLLLGMEEIKKKVTSQDGKIELIFNYLKQFIKEKEEPREVIGYKQNAKKK